jgi:hypothetical protein
MIDKYTDRGVRWLCAGLGFPSGLSHHLPHIKQEFDRPPGLISHPGEDKHDSPKKKVSPLSSVELVDIL